MKCGLVSQMDIHFVFGFSAYESILANEVKKTGVLQILQPDEKNSHKGHEVVAVGYDDSQKRFIVRNSWGRRLGNERMFHNVL
jgi:C1A family cysteine protease